MGTELVKLGSNELVFDEKTKIAQLDLQTLKRTVEAKDTFGQPLRGIYHHKVIDRVAEMCEKHRLNYAIEEIFAVRNQNKAMPGAMVVKELEEKYGQNAVEAHVVNRVFTTIRIDNGQTDELTTTIAIAYHQDGIQMAIGACVKVCHNQCILHPENTVRSYSKNGVPLEQMFSIVDSWLRDFDSNSARDQRRINRLKSMILTKEGCLISGRCKQTFRNTLIITYKF